MGHFLPAQKSIQQWGQRVFLLCCCCLLSACLGLSAGGPAAKKPSPAPEASQKHKPKGAATSKPSTDAPNISVAPAPAISATTQSACLVLALPDSGTFAAFAEKIRSGATAAQQELKQAGFSIDIRTVNSDQNDWVSQIDALPLHCAIVGGPLQAQNYTTAKSSELTMRRVVFTFMPQLPAGDEGTVAWRFFPGPSDQVTALLRFTKQELGITQYGAFYPADGYGTRMNGLFEQAARAAGGTVQAASYPPADLAQWTAAAANLVRPRTVNKVPISTATFGAVFLPDSWKNLDMIITSLVYNGEDRQVLLGTNLWEQSLAGHGAPNPQNYALAVFPGAWDRARTPPALQKMNAPDFWVGLGYDFVRFGATLALKDSPAPAMVNERIREAQNMIWTMAPLQWNLQGQASQQLFIFTPTENGYAPVDVEAFKERRQQAMKRFENRSRAASAQGN